MLVRSDPSGALLIGQLSHSWLSGQLARAWGNERFGTLEPREEIVLGAAQHDIGWARVDNAPRFDPQTGLPRTFLTNTVEEHLAIWRDAPDMLLSQSLHAALVVSLHGAALSERRARREPEEGRAPLDEHVRAERARQDRLCALLGFHDTERLQRQMWAWDGLSLALCNDWSPFTMEHVPTAGGELVDLRLERADDGRHTLDPWPFAEDAVTVRCEARRLDAPRYPDAPAMLAGWGRARPQALVFDITPPTELML